MHKNSTNTLIKKINNSEKPLKEFRIIPDPLKGEVLLGLKPIIRKKITNKLTTKELVLIAHYLDPDRVTDILQTIPKNKQKRVLKKLQKELRQKVEFLLRFKPESAAGLMNLNYLLVPLDISFKELLKKIREHEERTGEFPTILVENNGLLIGEVQGHKLLLADKKEGITKHIQAIPSVRFDADTQEVIKTFESNPKGKVAVINDDGSVIGIINSQELLRILGRSKGQSLSSFAGIKADEDVYDNPLRKVKFRYKWLIINLLTAFLASSVVSLFQDAIKKMVLLAVYMPIVAGMGGNAGTQALAVMVRGIALREITLKKALKPIIKELIAGAINGLIIGIIVTITAALFNNNLLLGLIVGISMIINLAIAGLFGALIPLIMSALGKDPASSATIFITTATDLCGFFVFLGLASMLL